MQNLKAPHHFKEFTKKWHTLNIISNKVTNKSKQNIIGRCKNAFKPRR